LAYFRSVFQARVDKTDPVIKNLMPFVVIFVTRMILQHSRALINSFLICAHKEHQSRHLIFHRNFVPENHSTYHRWCQSLYLLHILLTAPL